MSVLDVLEYLIVENAKYLYLIQSTWSIWVLDQLYLTTTLRQTKLHHLHPSILFVLIYFTFKWRMFCHLVDQTALSFYLLVPIEYILYVYKIVHVINTGIQRYCDSHLVQWVISIQMYKVLLVCFHLLIACRKNIMYVLINMYNLLWYVNHCIARYCSVIPVCMFVCFQCESGTQ